MRSALAAPLAWALALGLALAPLLAPPLGAQTRVAPRDATEIQLSFAPVVKRAAPAVVNIYTRKLVRDRVGPFRGDPFFDQFFRNFGGLQQQRLENSLGSGVIMRAEGVVVTNAHVIENAVAVRVALSDRREFDAEVIFADAPSDLAVLRLRGARDLPTLEVRGSDTLEVGDLALAIGNPYGVGQTVTSGIVSGLARTAGRRGSGYFIQTDAAINPGNSGGALVDAQGRLIGVNTAILSRSGGSVGIGFAIPAELVEQAVESALDGSRTLPRPWAGMRGQSVDAAIARSLGMARPAGVIVAELHPASPLRAAGLRRGDVVLRLNGEPVDTPEAFAFRLAALGVGGEAELDYLRDGRERRARMALVEAPKG
ncbi:MAG: trypsin-like peptidase domain-containing protein [Rubrimonas sp.]|uniref:trypsin-like peptidase domain-containing protein n=1 Tax=Rubrimonas sp. TaxID=2036015 RepID=UPI002FDD04EE